MSNIVLEYFFKFRLITGPINLEISNSCYFLSEFECCTVCCSNIVQRIVVNILFGPLEVVTVDLDCQA